MSNSDKDFITRIQVSQLVTDDPYADDFYFHIMAAIKYSRQKAILDAEMSAQGGMENSGNGLNATGNITGNGGKNLRTGERKMTRRENAMNKMAQNVQRLVDSANKRNKATQCTYLLEF